MQERDAEDLERLRRILARARRRSIATVPEAELLDALRLYRFANSVLARAEPGSPRRAELEELVGAAHSVLYREVDAPRAGLASRASAFFLEDVPRTVRGEWKLVILSFALVYGLALIAYVAVRHDLELAYALLSPEVVTQEIQALEHTAEGEAFRGNFTFGIGKSPVTAGWIMAHNMSVGILFFASGLVPIFYLVLLGVNGLMLGTYTAVASHWGRAFDISSILWCHGVIEIQAFILAGASGLVLVRAWIAPGPWSRREAMRVESARAWRLFAPTFPMLFVAGCIEGFVSPHAPLAVRIATAALSAVAIVGWFGFAGRGDPPPVSSVVRAHT